MNKMSCKMSCNDIIIYNIVVFCLKYRTKFSFHEQFLHVIFSMFKSFMCIYIFK